MRKLAIVLGVTTTLIVGGVVAGVVPATISSISETHHGYDLENLKQKIDDDDTFMVMFGQKNCSHCRTFYNALQDPNHGLTKEIKKIEESKNIDNLVHYYYNKYAWLRGESSNIEKYREFSPKLSNYIEETYPTNTHWKSYDTTNKNKQNSNTNTNSNTAKSISTPFVMIFKEGELQWLGNAGSSDNQYMNLQTQVKLLND